MQLKMIKGGMETTIQVLMRMASEGKLTAIKA
jgi:hypothetical protein